jgi:hypothetical protein
VANRGMSAAMLAEIAKAAVKNCYLVKCSFDSADLNMTNAYRDIVYDGDTYSATNGLLGFEGPSETAQLLVNDITVTLSGVDTSFAMAKIFEEDASGTVFVDRPIKIWHGFLDVNEALIVDPLKIFDGRMDNPVVIEDPESGTCTIAVKGTPAWADFGRRPGRHTNDAEQQFHFPGDKGMEFVSEIPKIINWGRA